MSTARGSGGSSSSPNTNSPQQNGTNSNNNNNNNAGGFGPVRNFLRETLAAKPAFLDTIKARGQQLTGGGGLNMSSTPNNNNANGATGKKPRANSLLPGDTDLIDQKSLFEADNTIAEVDFYLNRVMEDRPQRNSMIEKLKKLSRGTGSNGSMTGKTNQPTSQYQQLTQRLVHAELKLKDVVNDAVAQESSFTLQALHLTIRVKSCITFNKDSLPVVKEQLVEAQRMEAELDNWIKLINSMGKFQSELQGLNDMQYKFVPMSLRPKPDPEVVKTSEQLRSDMQLKLRRIEKVT
jgi:hypothetical protein